MEMEVAIFLPFHIFCFFWFLSGMYVLWSLILIQTEQKFVVCWMDLVEAARWLLGGLQALMVYGS